MCRGTRRPVCVAKTNEGRGIPADTCAVVAVAVASAGSEATTSETTVTGTVSAGAAGGNATEGEVVEASDVVDAAKEEKWREAVEEAQVGRRGMAAAKEAVAVDEAELGEPARDGWGGGGWGVGGGGVGLLEAIERAPGGGGGGGGGDEAGERAELGREVKEAEAEEGAEVDLVPGKVTTRSRAGDDSWRR